MKAATPSLLYLLESFFQQYLRQACGASPHTVRAYRDTLQLFFEFLAQESHRGMDRLQLSDITAQRVLDFLLHLEAKRGNGTATRNARRAALRSFVNYLLRHDLEHADQYARILALPAKRNPQSPPDYLEPEQFRLLLDQVDRQNPRGTRDTALLLFLYNTGARVSEALQIRWCDLHTQRPRQVRLRGKGNKERICPLWKQTADLLRRLQSQTPASPEERVFLNLRGQPLTRDGVAYLLRLYDRKARQADPSLPKRKVHPHTLRHSCAVGLLQAGVELTAIRDYLGHSSIATTGRYLQTNLATKREVLNRFWRTAGLEPKAATRWRPSQKLLGFLKSL
jgi:integrase/recombinase XerD